MDGGQKRERGRGRRTSGVDWRGMRVTSDARCPTRENGTVNAIHNHGSIPYIKKRNPPSSVIHHQEWKVIYVRSLLLESEPTTNVSGTILRPFWKPLY